MPEPVVVELSAAPKPDTALHRTLVAADATGRAAGTALAGGLAGAVKAHERWITQLTWGGIAAVFMFWFYRDLRADTVYQREASAQQSAALVTAFHALEAKMDARASAEEAMAAEMRASRIAIESIVRDIRTQLRPAGPP